MSAFTLITTMGENIHITQHQAATPQEALAKHVSRLPYDDGTGPFDEELEWLQRVAEGICPVTLVDVNGCEGTWMWVDGARHSPQYLTYVVRTEVKG